MIDIKIVTALGRKKQGKRKKENILLTAKWNGFLQSKLYEAENTGRPRNAGSKDKGFYKS